MPRTRRVKTIRREEFCMLVLVLRTLMIYLLIAVSYTHLGFIMRFFI